MSYITEETGAIQNPYRYRGYEYDPETKHYYLKSRYYNPQIARFISEDTYRGDRRDPLSLNLYTYCHNEPVMYVDPDGHRAVRPYHAGDGKSTPVVKSSKAKPTKPTKKVVKQTTKSTKKPAVKQPIKGNKKNTHEVDKKNLKNNVNIGNVKDNGSKGSDVVVGYSKQYYPKYKYEQEIEKISKAYRTNQRNKPNARTRALARAGKNLEKNKKIGGKIGNGIGVFWEVSYDVYENYLGKDKNKSNAYKNAKYAYSVGSTLAIGAADGITMILVSIAGVAGVTTVPVWLTIGVGIGISWGLSKVTSSIKEWFANKVDKIFKK